MSDDPHIAALAGALHIAEHQIDGEWWEQHPLSLKQDMERHTTQAAAILAALPDDWCGHSGFVVESSLWRKWAEDEIADTRAEIARLRRIEEEDAEEIERLVYEAADFRREIARYRRIEEAARLPHNVVSHPDFAGEWVMVPRADFDALRAALEEKP